MDIILNNLLVHYILRREVEDNRDDAMTFDFYGTIVTFSKEEFLLATWLWRSPNPVVIRRVQAETAGSLRSRYFRNDFSGDIDIGNL